MNGKMEMEKETPIQPLKRIKRRRWKNSFRLRCCCFNNTNYSIISFLFAYPCCLPSSSFSSIRYQIRVSWADTHVVCMCMCVYLYIIIRIFISLFYFHLYTWSTTNTKRFRVGSDQFFSSSLLAFVIAKAKAIFHRLKLCQMC